MSEESYDDKQHEPSQKKLEDARKRGELPRSTDLLAAASYGGFLLVYATFGSFSLVALCKALMTFLEGGLWAGKMGLNSQLVNATLVSGLRTMVSWVATSAVLVLVLLLMMRGIVFSPQKLKPKLSRISIVSNAKNKFGRSGLFEFAKNFLKLTVYSVALTMIFQSSLSEISGLVFSTPGQVFMFMAHLSARFMLVAFCVAVAIGFIDYLWQRSEHLRKNKMSDKELRDEHKEAEGDPYLKGARRQKAEEFAQNQIAAKVPEADVVIVNPEHYAVALKWDRLPNSAPVCIAKGVDEIALRIKAIALENGIPIHGDPPTARALYASVELDEEIHPEHYRVVAAAIRFADRVNNQQTRPA